MKKRLFVFLIAIFALNILTVAGFAQPWRPSHWNGKPYTVEAQLLVNSYLDQKNECSEIQVYQSKDNSVYLIVHGGESGIMLGGYHDDNLAVTNALNFAKTKAPQMKPFSRVYIICCYPNLHHDFYLPTYQAEVKFLLPEETGEVFTVVEDNQFMYGTRYYVDEQK